MYNTNILQNLKAKKVDFKYLLLTLRRTRKLPK